MQPLKISNRSNLLLFEILEEKRKAKPKLLPNRQNEVGLYAWTWPRRPAVKTPGFHPGNRSSTLRGVTIQNASSKDGAFCMVDFRRKSELRRSAIARSSHRSLLRVSDDDIQSTLRGVTKVKSSGQRSGLFTLVIHESGERKRSMFVRLAQTYAETEPSLYKKKETARLEAILSAMIKKLPRLGGSL